MLPPADPPARLWPYLLVNFAVAVWIDFSRIHILHNSDSLIYTLSAVYEWRPFFWEQDRVGLLWPLLLSWCRNPLAALLLQTGVTTYLGLCLPVLFARVVTPHRAGPLIATAASAAVLWLAPAVVLDNWLVSCNYPGALSLGLAAILLLDRSGGGWVGWVGRTAAAVALLFAACWLYVGVVLFLVPFALGRGWLPRPTPARSWWWAVCRPVLNPGVVLTVLGSAVAVGGLFVLMRHTADSDASVRPMRSESLQPEEWAEVYGGLIGSLFREPGVPELAILFGVAVAGGVVWGWQHDALTMGRLALQTLPAVVAAVGEYAFLGTRFWVRNNSCHPRYLVAVLTALCLSALLTALVPPLARFRVRWWVGVLAFGLVFVAATVRLGLPGPGVPRQVIDGLWAERSAELHAAGVDAVGGGYWDVWPLVFHLNLRHYERGEQEAWGVSGRSGPWAHRWQAEPGRVYRVGVSLPEDKTAEDEVNMADLYAREYGLVRVSGPVARVGRVTVYEYRAEGP